MSRMSQTRALAWYPSLLLTKKESISSSTKTREGEFWEARMDCWRPTVNDVERISWGKPAKKKGTGSRGVPHRLNEQERFLFDQARRKGFLEITGSGWRSQRREAPLLNSYRSLCDARGQASIVLHKGSDGVDKLVVDISPLRTPETFLLYMYTTVDIHVLGHPLLVGVHRMFKRKNGERRFNKEDVKKKMCPQPDPYREQFGQLYGWTM